MIPTSARLQTGTKQSGGSIEQNDIAIGKGERTLALILDVTSWYTLDSAGREAVAKSRQLWEWRAR
jgi:hypothetical protein